MSGGEQGEENMNQDDKGVSERRCSLDSIRSHWDYIRRVVSALDLLMFSLFETSEGDGRLAGKFCNTTSTLDGLVVSYSREEALASVHEEFQFTVWGPTPTSGTRNR